MSKSPANKLNKSNPRALADDEERLWAEVRKRTTKLEGVTPRAMSFDAFFEALDKPVTPLKTQKQANPAALPKMDTAHLAQLWSDRPGKTASPCGAPQKPKKAPIDPIEPRLRRRIVGGREDIDAKIDLHGLTQADAHPVLIAFIQRSFSRGFRTVLVITGKGRSKGSEGVLRRMVPMWLNQPEIKLLVSGWDESSPNHGGAGALYVRLKNGAKRQK